jgi:hypothetical protein
MYSKKDKKNKSFIERVNNNYDYSEDNKISSSSSQRNIYYTNNLNNKTNNEDDQKVDSDYLNRYNTKKKNKSFVSYYSKKKLKSININEGKPQISNYIIRPGHIFSDINNFNGIQRMPKIVTYTIKNPQKEKSKNKNKIKNNNRYFEQETSKYTTINRDEFEDDLNEYNSSLKTNDLYCTENNKIYNGYKSSRENINLSRYIKNKKPKISEKNDNLLRSSSNASRSISFIMDYSKYDDKDCVCFGSPNVNANKITLNSSINKNPKSPSYSHNFDESTNARMESSKTPNKKDKIRKKIEFNRQNFENMRKIVKNIKNYFLINGISSKNRELYHQSAIMIQSTFRSYLLSKIFYKELNFLVGIRILFNWINKKLVSNKNFYYDVFLII